MATAARLPGSPAADVADFGPAPVSDRSRGSRDGSRGGSDGRSIGPGNDSVILEHPTGTFEAAVSLSMDEDGPVADRSGIIRTARKLMDGTVFPTEY